MSRTLILIAAGIALLAALLLLTTKGPGLDRGFSYDWELTATEGRIIGGYGDNFRYDGENVRPVGGQAVLRIDTDAQEGVVEARVFTTSESGPLVIAQGVSLEGEIRLVMEVGDPSTRLAEYLYLHGDSGNGPPVMPKLFNYLTGWGPLDIYANGRLIYKGLAGHLMFSEGSRRPDGTIRRDDGTIYSPKLLAERGFTNPERTEFHLVAHTTEPDANNFPPNTVWVHLQFSRVVVERAKPGPRPIPGYAPKR